MKPKNLIILIIALSFLPGIFTQSKSQPIFKGWEKNVVAIQQKYPTLSEATTIATGFLVDVNGYPFLVTAGHVLKRPGNLYFRTYRKNPTSTSMFIEKSQYSLQSSYPGLVYPITHKEYKNATTDHGIDIACIFFPTTPDEDIMSLIENTWVKDKEIISGEEIFLLGYPHSKQSPHGEPIVRWGTVMTNVQKGLFLVDGATDHGDSGGPVFLKLFSLDKGEPTNDTRQAKLVGVISGGNVYGEFTRVISADKIRELFQQSELIDLLNKLKAGGIK